MSQLFVIRVWIFFATAATLFYFISQNEDFPSQEPFPFQTYPTSLEPVRPPRIYKVFTADVHITPPADFKDILRQIGDYEVIDQSLSGHCHIMGTCATHLRVLKQEHHTGAMNCCIKKQFWEAYRSDTEMNSIDFFFCSHGIATCEIYLPFGKPLFIMATTRMETGRTDADRWKKWVDVLKLLAKNGKNVIAANNQFDRKYIQYFTGLEDHAILYLPSYCGYVPSKVYTHKSPRSWLIGPRRFSPYGNEMANRIQSLLSVKGLSIQTIEQQYPGRYELEDLASHPGIIFVPYQVSLMTFFELYRMNVPILCPSKSLLATWHLQGGILNELTWSRIDGHPSASPIPAALPGWPDPNKDFERESLEFWLQYADFYTFPYITYFNSIEELYQIIQVMPLEEISNDMRRFNEQQREELLNIYQQIVLPRLTNSQPVLSANASSDYLTRVKELYPEMPNFICESC